MQINHKIHNPNYYTVNAQIILKIAEVKTENGRGMEYTSSAVCLALLQASLLSYSVGFPAHHSSYSSMVRWIYGNLLDI